MGMIYSRGEKKDTGKREPLETHGRGRGRGEFIRSNGGEAKRRRRRKQEGKCGKQDRVEVSWELLRSQWNGKQGDELRMRMRSGLWGEQAHDQRKCSACDCWAAGSLLLVNWAAFTLCCCPSVEGPRISQSYACHAFSAPFTKHQGSW